ncbi:MAG: cytoplasmic protein [Mycobacteriales bacterium]
MGEDMDPTSTNPDQYKVVFENDRVRVLEYRDTPGVITEPHAHPDSVMVTLSGFDRRLTMGDQTIDVTKSFGESGWLPAQTHIGHNTGTTDTHAIFIELK